MSFDPGKISIASSLRGDCRREHDILESRILRKQIELLENHTEMQPLSADLLFRIALLPRGVKDRLAFNQKRTGIRRFEEVQASQERCFAAAGGADDRKCGPLLHRKRDALKHLRVLKILSDISDFQYRCACCHV